MLKLAHFPANNAWGFIFGCDVATVAHVQLAGEPMLFQYRTQAVEAAGKRDIFVDRTGLCTALDCRPEPTSADTDG